MNEERVNAYATAVLALSSIAALGVPALRGVAALVAVALFLGGVALMAAALVIAAQRSREVSIGIGELFFGVPRPMLIGLGAQVVIGLGTAAVRPYTSSALGVLAPVAGLGLCGLWGARRGAYPPREA